MSRLLAVSENYPQLKADGLFRDLQAQLEGTENRITVARNRYIKAVQAYNVTVRSFPTNLTAKVFGYKIKPNFAVENEKAIATAAEGRFRHGAPGRQALIAHMHAFAGGQARSPGWRAALGLLLLLSLCGAVSAEVAVPPFHSYVTDLTETLSAQQRETLEQTLRDFASRKGSQLAVLLVPSTAPESIEQYSIRVVDSWKLGRKGVDDGVLLLVATRDRTLRIEVGYGLEGVIPDAIANRIINEVVVPYFKRGDYFGGIQAGVHQLMRLIQGESLPPPSQRDRSWEGLQAWLPLLLMITVVGGFILRRIFGRWPGVGFTAALTGVIGWLIFGSLLFGIVIGLSSSSLC